MTVQTPEPQTAPEPDIDAGVIEDAKARQRRHRWIGASVVAAGLAAGALVLGFTGGGGGSGPASGHHGGRPSPVTGLPSSTRPTVLLRGLRNFEAYAAGARLWVMQQTSPQGSTVVDEIMRVNPSTGRVLATRNLGATYWQALLARGVLWVTSTVGRSVWLWRLQPDSLAVMSKNLLPGSVPGGESFGVFGTLAVAGGWLWVGEWDTLDRVSLATAEAMTTSRIPGAQGVDVASNPSGSVLVDSEGNERSRVQRRDPQTGRLLAQSPLFGGVTKPQIGGILGNGIWLTEPTGSMGFAERISVKTLRPTRLAVTRTRWADVHAPLIEGSNGITARVIDNVLWINQYSGGAADNYCGDPATGKPRSHLKLGATAGELLAVGADDIYYLPGLAGGGMRPQLDRAPIDPRC